MSAKAKNPKIEIVDATEAPASDRPVAAVTAPDDAAPPAEGTPASEAVAVKPPLAARVKIAGNQAVLVSFAAVRTAQATAIQKALVWVAVLDTALTRSLTATEQFLLTRLGTAAPAPAPAPES